MENEIAIVESAGLTKPCASAMQMDVVPSYFGLPNRLGAFGVMFPGKTML
jgi:hypothetical protein